jgi:hypothetical protein
MPADEQSRRESSARMTWSLRPERATARIGLLSPSCALLKRSRTTNSASTVRQAGRGFRTRLRAAVLIRKLKSGGHWSNWAKFSELERRRPMMYGQMTANSWIYRFAGRCAGR